jgi:hypothetical protein
MINVEQNYMDANEGIVAVEGLPKDLETDGNTVFETAQEAFDYLAEELPGVPVNVNINPRNLDLQPTQNDT